MVRRLAPVLSGGGFLPTSGHALVDHPRGDEGMMVVLKTESEDMKFFFQG